MFIYCLYNILFEMPCWLLKAFPNCHCVCHQITNMYAPISTSCGSNHGSLVFIRFRYPVVNSPTHSPKSLDHFLLIDHAIWTNVMFITLQVGRCNVLVMGNNKTTNQPYNVMTSNLSLGQSMLKLHCILCVFVWLSGLK